MSAEVIDLSKYGETRPRNPKWEVMYEGNGRGDGIRITAVFEPEDLDAVVASIRRQMECWANEPKPTTF